MNFYKSDDSDLDFEINSVEGLPFERTKLSYEEEEFENNPFNFLIDPSVVIIQKLD